MIRPLVVLPAAEADLDQIYRYLEQQRPGQGDRFRAKLKELFNRIESSPEIFGVRWRNVRAVRVHTFQYVVYYRMLENLSEVIAIMHGARHAARWKGRLKRDSE